MEKINISMIYSETLKLIELFCQAGSEAFKVNEYEKASELFYRAFSIARLFACDSDSKDIFAPVVARCVYLYGEAQDDETIIWKAVLYAVKYCKTDYFCEFIVDTGKKRLGVSDEGLQLLADNIKIDYYDIY